jgi:UDP-glucose 4-epimerase
MLADFEKSHGLFSAALRYFNAAGADLEVQIGEAHRPETHLIPLAIQTAFGKKPHFTLYGNDFPTPDGTAVRDYIHVADLADAHVKALNALMTKKTSIAVNLGTGHGYSVQEILNAVQKFTKTRIQIQIHPRSASDSAALVANCRRAGEILNWKPKYSDLETIISTACEWHRSQLE